MSDSYLLEQIKADPRPIKSIMLATGEEWGQGWWSVGSSGVTQITIEHELGPMAPLLWFEVWREDVVVMRVNSLHVAKVTYSW